MITVDFPHQQRILAAGQYVETWRIPCEGSLSRVEGIIILIAKDYVNQPTISQLDIQLQNQQFLLMPNDSLNFGATFGGVPVTPVPNLKDTDVGIPIYTIVTAGGGNITITISFSAVPDTFMLYIRPQLRITGLKEPLKPQGGRQEAIVPPIDSFWPKPIEPIEVPPLDRNRQRLEGQGIVGQVDVVKEVVKNNINK